MRQARPHDLPYHRFEPTADHAPEAGLGGSEYHVTGANGILYGTVRSTWNRTAGVHWQADGPDGRTIGNDRRTEVPRAWETRQHAAAYLVRHVTAQREDQALDVARGVLAAYRQGQDEGWSAENMIDPATLLLAQEYLNARGISLSRNLSPVPA